LGLKEQSGVLNWNANGTLQQLTITDGLNPGSAQTCTHLYDDLGRLGPSSTVPGVNCVDGSQNVWQQMFTCDPFGNTKKSGSSSFQATYNGSNQITNLGRSIDGGNQRYRTRSNRTLLTPTFFMLVMDKVPWSTLPSSLR
jgi:hypothetical protein